MGSLVPADEDAMESPIPTGSGDNKRKYTSLADGLNHKASSFLNYCQQPIWFCLSS